MWKQKATRTLYCDKYNGKFYVEPNTTCTEGPRLRLIYRDEWVPVLIWARLKKWWMTCPPASCFKITQAWWVYCMSHKLYFRCNFICKLQHKFSSVMQGVSLATNILPIDLTIMLAGTVPGTRYYFFPCWN